MAEKAASGNPPRETTLAEENAFLRKELELVTAKLVRVDALRLEEQMAARRRDRGFRFFQELYDELIAARDRDGIYRATVRALTRRVGFDRAVIYRRTKGIYTPVAAEGYTSAAMTDDLANPFFAPWVEAEGAVLVNGRNRSEVSRDFEEALKVRYFIAAAFPFSIGNGERHILFAGNQTEETVRRPPLTEADKETLTTLARQIGVALENVTLYHTLEARVKERTRLLESEIAERKRAEAETEALNRRLNTLIEALPDAVYFKDSEGRYLVVNAAFEQMNGVVRSLILGRTDPEIFDGALATFYQESDRKVMARRRVIHSVVEVPGPGEERLILDCVKVPLFDLSGETVGLVGMNRDVTRQKRMENELFRARKLEAIGILAGGIAHDFNNLLTVILGNLSLCRMDGTLSESDDRILAGAEEAAGQARELTRKLILFSKGGEPNRRPLSLSGLLRELADEARKRLSLDTELEIPAGLPMVAADEGQLRMAIFQVMENAGEAMAESGGTFRLRAEAISVDGAEEARLTPGRYVRITLRDAGPGIAAEHLADIFDPYFTTKSMGPDRGVGLGLSIVHSVMNRHEGLVTVESFPGKGAAFHLFLPVLDDSSEAAQAGPDESREKTRVLLMDDEAPVREVAAAMLRRLGCDVVSVSEGNRAVEAFVAARKANRPFAAVILDLTVKMGVGGLTTLKRLKEIDPAVPAIVSSGYSNDPVLQNPWSYGFRGVIPKPYGIHDLR
ncbi:MAG: PAS domain-containing protein, partial [Desulfococcaceae bacterium]